MLLTMNEASIVAGGASSGGASSDGAATAVAAARRLQQWQHNRNAGVKMQVPKFWISATARVLNCGEKNSKNNL